MSEVSYLCIVHRIPRQVPCPPLQAKPPSPPLSDSPHPLPPSPRQAPPFLNPKSSIWNIQPDQIFSWTPELRENHHRQPPLTFRHRASFFSRKNFHKMCVSKLFEPVLLIFEASTGKSEWNDGLVGVGTQGSFDRAAAMLVVCCAPRAPGTDRPKGWAKQQTSR